MKSFKGITIAYMLIAIATISAQEKNVFISSKTPYTIELTHSNTELSQQTYFLKDSLSRNWSTYRFIQENGGLSALVSNYASEIFILENDSALQRGWPEPHYALQHSAYAMKSGKIFGYGGYGYWTSKNILRYWNNKKGWVPILTSDDSDPLTPTHNSVLIINDSNAYIFGGETTDARNPFIRSDVQLIQIVNLKTKKVTKEAIPYSLSQTDLVMQNDTLVIFKENGKLISYNFINNVINETLINEEIDLTLQIMIDKEEFEKTIINYVSQEKSINLWSKVNIVRYGLFSLLIIIILSLLMKSVIQNKPTEKRIILENATIKYGKNISTLNREQVRLIQILLEKDYCGAEDLNTIFSKDLSTSHLNKLRSASIKSINEKIQTLSNNSINEFICIRKAKHDSRMIQYFIPDSHKPI